MIILEKKLQTKIDILTGFLWNAPDAMSCLGFFSFIYFKLPGMLSFAR